MTLEQFAACWDGFVVQWVAARADGPEAQRKLVSEALAAGLPTESPGDQPEARPRSSERRRCEVAVLRASGLFDAAAYAKANAEARKKHVNPLEHFCRVGWHELRNPSRKFDLWWYWAEYLDPKRDDVNPLLHYALVGRAAGFEPVPPVEERRAHVAYDAGQSPRRVCLFAGYDPDGLVDDYVVDYLRELSRHADVYYLADGYMEPEELDKLSDVTRGAWAVAHGAYDFGSYSLLARELVGWDTIDEYDEMVLANDSGFLLRPLDEVFAEMDGRPCDWWGLQATRHDFDRWSNGGQPLPMEKAKEKMIGQRFMGELDHLHISSYFLVYRRPVLRDEGFRRRLSTVVPQAKKVLVIYKYEIGLSRYLMCRGFDFSTFVPDLYAFHPLYTEQYFELLALGFPLLKRNFLSENSRNIPDLVDWRDRVRAVVPDAPVDVIEQNLVRVAHDDHLRRSFGLVTGEDGTVTHHKPFTWWEVIDEDRVAPKYDHWWAFPVDPDHHVLSPEQRALFEEVRDDPTIKKVVLTRGRRIELEGQNVSLVPLQSREGQRQLMRSRTVFVAQTPRVSVPYPMSPRRHRFVHVGGGARLHQPVPVTAVQDDAPGRDNARCAAAVASSRVDALAAAAALSPLALDDVWITGSLRNDLLLASSDRLSDDLREQEARLRAVVGSRRLVLLALQESASASDVARFPTEDLEWLMEWCGRHDAVLGYRDHRADRSRRLSRVLRPLGAMPLPPREYPYPEIVARVADAVVTDHARIGVDFSVTGRPVVSYLPDGPDGTRLVHDLEEVLPGVVCSDRVAFRAAMECVFESPDAAERAELLRRRSLMFERVDAHNARRLVRRVRELDAGQSVPGCGS